MNEEGFISPSEARAYFDRPLLDFKDAKMVDVQKLSKEKIAKAYQVPYWFIEGPRPTWFQRPIWRARAWWWTHRWDRTIYDGKGKFKNGITWWRFTSGPFTDWGLWIWEGGECASLHADEPSGPRIWVGDFYGREVWILKPYQEES